MAANLMPGNSLGGDTHALQVQVVNFWPTVYNTCYKYDFNAGSVSWRDD